MSEAKERSDESVLTPLLSCCEMCNDGDGQCVYPYSGVAPHTHGGAEFDGAAVFGSTKILDKQHWPENFRLEPGSTMTGVYTHCLHCGRPERQQSR